MIFYFLQVPADSLNRAVAAQHGIPEPGTSISLWDLLLSGGWLMMPLFGLFILAVFFFFERLIAIRNAGKVDYNFMSIIRDHVTNGNVMAARSLAKNTFNPVARMIDKGLQRVGKPIEAIEKSMENVGKLEVYKMERNLSVLSLIAGIAPMFGFLGTIVGMVQLFYGISSTGEYTLSTIAGGIYTKMVTSATGLIIGLLSYVGHSYLNAQIEKNVNRMEAASSEFIDLLYEPTK